MKQWMAVSSIVLLEAPYKCSVTMFSAKPQRQYSSQVHTDRRTIDRDENGELVVKIEKKIASARSGRSTMSSNSLSPSPRRESNGLVSYLVQNPLYRD
ncbi:hypothetical protein OSTOST_02349 [Ostertagia ostertagi]